MISSLKPAMQEFGRMIAILGFEMMKDRDYFCAFSNGVFDIEFDVDRHDPTSMNAVIHHHSDTKTHGMAAWDVMAVVDPARFKRLSPRPKDRIRENYEWVSGLAEFLVARKDDVFLFPPPYVDEYDKRVREQMKKAGLAGPYV